MTDTTMLEQAELTRSAVSLAQGSGMLAACNVVHALASGASVDLHLRELSARTARLVDAAADLTRELAAILDDAAIEDQRRATDGSSSSVWLAPVGADRVADQLRDRLLRLADQAVPVASAASDVIGQLPRAQSNPTGMQRRHRLQQVRRRARSLTHRGL